MNSLRAVVPVCVNFINVTKLLFFNSSFMLFQNFLTEVAGVNVFTAAVVLLLNKQLKSENFLPLHMFVFGKPSLVYFFF